VLADPKGRQLSSEALADELAQLRDRGVQHLLLAVGPADGWSPGSLERADLRLSFGPMTLPHELAAVLAAEQIYRATTIWSGHPYHGGH
jgi:23S rRNA (pseudouridine1915-N3)-methyltransferase